MERKKIGKYEILAKIGKGGFGVVYKGFDPYIKRYVAIKTCEVEDKDVRERFFREAQLAGNLQHLNITTIYDFGVEGDVPYIVQEFLSGEDLDILLSQNHPFTFQQKVNIILGVCKGLEEAHKAGIIHRDIKPGNIRILDDGSVKIMDFGIAKSKTSASKLTQTGTTVGTASYLAPEQIKGLDLDPRTDLFSLGVVMYELFTGVKPFQGDNITTVIYKILHEHPVPPQQINPDIPPELDAIIMKCLSKNPEGRFDSARSLYLALRQFVRRETSERLDQITLKEVAKTRPMDVTPLTLMKPKAHRRYTIYLVVFLFVFLGVAFSWVYLSKMQAESVPTRPLIILRNPLHLPESPPLWSSPPPFPKGEEETKVFMGKVLLKSSQPVVAVIDGKQRYAVPPAKEISLTEGEHRITWIKGNRKKSDTFFARRKSTVTLENPLVAKGFLRVVAKMGTPYGIIYVDGKKIGPSPVHNFPLSAGKHTVRIEREGYTPLTYTVIIEENKQEVITFDLRGGS